MVMEIELAFDGFVAIADGGSLPNALGTTTMIQWACSSSSLEQ